MSLSEYPKSFLRETLYSSIFFSRAIFSALLTFFSFFLSSFLPSSVRPSGFSLIFSSCHLLRAANLLLLLLVVLLAIISEAKWVLLDLQLLHACHPLLHLSILVALATRQALFLQLGFARDDVLFQLLQLVPLSLAQATRLLLLLLSLFCLLLLWGSWRLGCCISA